MIKLTRVKKKAIEYPLELACHCQVDTDNELVLNLI